MRKYLIGLVLIIAAVIVVIILQQPNHRTLHKTSSGITNAQFPYLANPNTVDFFTGTSFAAYGPASGATTTISPQFALPVVTTMRWSKTGVLFEASGYTKNDDLFQALANKHQAITLDYWWLYNFSNQELSLVLPPNIQNRVVDAYWSSSGDSYSYISNDNTLHISSNPKKVLYHTATGARIKQFNGDSVVIAEGDNLNQIDIASGAKQTLVNANFQDSYISPDMATIAYVVNTHPKATSVVPGDLYTLNPASKGTHKLLSDFGGVLSGDKGNLYFAYQDTSNLNHLELHPSSGKATVYGLGSVVGKNTSITQVIPKDAEDFYLTSGTNLFEAKTTTQTSPSLTNNFSAIKGDYYLDGFEIHYQPIYNTYEIDITKNPYSTYQNNALKYIRNHHVDPNQITIVWRAYDGVNNTNSHVDTAPIILK